MKSMERTLLKDFETATDELKQMARDYIAGYATREDLDRAHRNAEGEFNKLSVFLDVVEKLLEA